MKLSIITINYNNCAGLQKTIDSVVNQTWRDFEWIIIDGGSTDGSKELIEKYQEYFAYWCSEPDKGVYNAMNKGIVKAKGEYLNFMNSGDFFYEHDTLEKVFSVERKADVLYGDWMQVYNDHTNLMHFPEPVEIYTFYQRNICQQAMFVRATIMKEKGFDESFKIIADYCRWVELVQQGVVFEFVHLIICLYDMNGISSVRSSEDSIEKERMLRNKIPKAVSISLDRLDQYERDWTVIYLKRLLSTGGIMSFLSQLFLKLFHKLFVNELHVPNSSI